MIPIRIKYPLDPTGVNTTNLVIGEEHVLNSSFKRAFVPNYAAFFTESVVLVDKATGRVLTKALDWIAVELEPEATALTGKEVCCVLVVVNEEVSNNVVVQYQAVGDKYSFSTAALEELLRTIQVDLRTVPWGQIIDKPAGWVPTQHMHTPDDLYGFEQLIEAINDLAYAVLIGDEASHDLLRQQFREELAILQADLDNHKSRIDNPHAVTKAQVGLGLVENLPVATNEEALVGLTNLAYSTPLRVRQEVTPWIEGVQSNLDMHKNNRLNPHEVNKTQVGLGLVNNFGIADQPTAESGESNAHYSTPLSVKWYVDLRLSVELEPFKDHLTDRNNPHEVSKAQVGLGVVENWRPSTEAQAQTGNTHDSYMTPVRVHQAFDYMIQPFEEDLYDHVNSFDNPHRVTHVQVGLGLVHNYDTATKSIAEAGDTNESYMTPLSTFWYVDKRLAIDLQPFKDHLNDFDNPHEVNKTQVGLELVNNYGTATPAETRDGVANNLYVTPAGVNLALTEVADDIRDDLWSHVNDVNNPHVVTKTQVKLGKVNDYATANLAESRAGVAWDLYLTPAGAKALINDNVLPLNDDLLAHMQDTSNPHQTNKAQVGLGDVANYRPASTIECQERVNPSNALYVTPAGLQGAISNRMATVPNFHYGTSNPVGSIGINGDIYIKYG